MPYKAIIFDLYGTLVDNFSLEKHETVLREMASILGAPPDEFMRMWFDSYEWRAIGKITSPEENIELICRKLGIPLDEEKIQSAGEVRRKFTRKGLDPWSDGIPVLQKLRQMGYKTALISDCSAETPESWPDTPLVSLMDVTAFSCVVGLKKPDPRIYLQTAERLGVKPEECLYVGDGSSQELSGAAAVGMHPVMIRSALETPDNHRIHEEDWQGPRITALTELLTLIANSQAGTE
jgi:putative hydrolase of the HAD superfamily